MNNVDWTKAPEGAEFYANGEWFKESGTALLSFSDGEWTEYVGLLANQMIKALQKEPDYQQRPEEPKVKHYTGQMTKEELKHTKIRILSPEHSKAFQEMCFEAGVCWELDIRTKQVGHTEKRYIYVMDNTIYHDDDTHEYFLRQPETRNHMATRGRKRRYQ